MRNLIKVISKSQHTATYWRKQAIEKMPIQDKVPSSRTPTWQVVWALIFSVKN